MKTLLTFTAIIVCLSLDAQDTLYLNSGEIQLVELISINKEAGLIKYKFDGQTQIRSISSLKSFSNNGNVDSSNWPLDKGTFESDKEALKFVKTSVKDPNKYAYGKFSIGVNLLSVFSSQGYQFDRTIASNYNQSFYLQYNLTDQIGFRLPMRIGFNRLKDTTTVQESGYSWKYDRTLIGEIGIETIFMFDDKRKVTPYFMPGIYFGMNQGVISNYNDSIPNLSTFYPAPKHNYYRIGITGGIQFNFSKYIQLNTEIGFNINTTNVYYSEPYNQYSSSPVVTSYVYAQIGPQAAINLVYRFGGKLRD